MKKTILILAIAILSLSGYSQSKISFGFRGGANISNLSNSNLDNKTGFYLAAIIPIKFSGLYTLQPELGYSNQGGNGNIMDENANIHYISLAVANKFFVQNSGLHFIIAPGIDFDSDDTFIGISNRTEGNGVTFMDVSMGLGMGYDFNNGFGIEARYKLGVVDVYSDFFNSFESEQYERESQLNKVFQLGIFYKFKF